MSKPLYYALGSGWAAINNRRPVGRSIYDADWDICIVLDSLRYDTACRCLAESSLEATTGAAWSRGSVTTEWLANTFRTDSAPDIAETTLLSATPHTETVFHGRSWLTNPAATPLAYPNPPTVAANDFRRLEELWRTHATDHDAVPPSTMADATIEAYREDGDRVVAHWLQPHEPFIAPDAQLVGGKALSANVWQGLQNGTLAEDAVRQSYRATAQLAFEHVETVANAVDATILITADHGNAFGEWGIYGHPFAWPQPAVRRVPWLMVDASNKTEYEPPETIGQPSTDTDGERESQLQALGYR